MHHNLNLYFLQRSGANFGDAQRSPKRNALTAHFCADGVSRFVNSEGEDTVIIRDIRLELLVS